MAGFDGAPGRADEFNAGITGDDPGSSPTSSGQDAGLALSAQQFAARANMPGVRPTSVLQPLAPSANGFSAGDAARRTIDGTYLGSGNGQSESSFERAALLKLTGQNSA
jgi:hypothetical protein